MLDLNGSEVLRLDGRESGAQPLDVSTLSGGRYTVIVEGDRQVFSSAILVR